jgi:hypothetical protein
MMHRKRIHALGRTSVVVSIGMALSACTASKYPAPTGCSPILQRDSRILIQAPPFPRSS